jgi:hypothetical protein
MESPESKTVSPEYTNIFLMPGLLVTAWVKKKVAIDFDFQPVGAVISRQKKLSYQKEGVDYTIVEQTQPGFALKLGSPRGSLSESIWCSPVS